MRANCRLRRKAAKAFPLEEDPLPLPFALRLEAVFGFFDIFFLTAATFSFHWTPAGCRHFNSHFSIFC